MTVCRLILSLISMSTFGRANYLYVEEIVPGKLSLTQIVFFFVCLFFLKVLLIQYNFADYCKQLWNMIKIKKKNSSKMYYLCPLLAVVNYGDIP